MRTAPVGMGTAAGADTAAREDSDLTARARIRDAAIECFAAEGFGASVRSIAARAGVSPGLITHHFGSKQALHAQCDTEVLRRYRELKRDSISRPTGKALRLLDDLEGNGVLLVYVLRSIQAGGDLGRAFVDSLMDDAREYMAEGVASGLIRPSRDEEARLRYLTYQSLGALLMEFTLNPQLNPANVPQFMRELQHSSFLPTLELLSEGLLTSTEMLDEYLAYAGRTDTDHAPPG